MGKSIFQRLAEYLRDLTAQGEAAPPSAGDPDDKRQPRLIAIEGGKGKGEPDGNEREKPCAVIGIPYSSDAAEETVENEEEDAMKQMKKYMYGVGAAVAAVFALSACGGGGEEARAEQGGQEGERRRAHAVVCESNKRVSAGTFVSKRKEGMRLSH